MTELIECIQAGAVLWTIIAFSLALWPAEWALRRLGERWEARRRERWEARRREARRRERRIAWLREPERGRGHVVSIDVLPDCLEPREPQGQGVDVPVAFRRAFGGE